MTDSQRPDALTAEEITGVRQSVRAGHGYDGGTARWNSRWLATLSDDLTSGLQKQDRLANVLHDIGGEFCHPFTEYHPIAMHRSQAAAILSALRSQP